MARVAELKVGTSDQYQPQAQFHGTLLSSALPCARVLLANLTRISFSLELMVPVRMASRRR
jgi:hypothetical protein